MKKLLWMLVGLLLLGGAAAVYSFSAYYSSQSEGALQTVIIAPNTGARALVAQLHREGLVPPFAVMALPLFLATDYTALKAGEYELSHAMSPAEIMQKIIRGEVVVHKVTIPEGWNMWQVRAALMAEPLLTGELPATIPEGSVLPDTMHFSRGEARSAVLVRMQKAQASLMQSLWATRAPNLPFQTPEEALVLASVVEKETGVGGERSMVAGVFVNRLRLGMPLQSDPTVIYGIELAQDGAPLGRPLTRGDLRTDTPHNSYTRRGLPPTPICNAGAKAIEAVLNPATTEALYFVATGHGGHAFAATLAEHQRYVEAYRAVMAAGQ